MAAAFAGTAYAICSRVTTATGKLQLLQRRQKRSGARGVSAASGATNPGGGAAPADSRGDRTEADGGMAVFVNQLLVTRAVTDKSGAGGAIRGLKQQLVPPSELAAVRGVPDQATWEAVKASYIDLTDDLASLTQVCTVADGSLTTRFLLMTEISFKSCFEHIQVLPSYVHRSFASQRHSCCVYLIHPRRVRRRPHLQSDALLGNSFLRN
jgi:hypothetical protein